MGLTKLLLQEIGEGKNYYSFTKKKEMMNSEDEFVIEYRFRTPENEYIVYFEKWDGEHTVEVGFNSDKSGKKKVVEPTDEHDTIKVMSTVLTIAKQFNKEYPDHNTFRISFPWFDKMSSKKRRRVYRYFIEKFFPEVKIKKVFRDLIVQL